MTRETGPPPQLDYAPGRSLVTRIGRKRVIWGTVLIAVALAVIVWTDPLVRRIRRWNDQRQFLALQQKAMRYTAPPELIVYEEDPGRAAALLAKSPSYATIWALDARHAQVARPGWQLPVNYHEPLWAGYGRFRAAPGVYTPNRCAAFLHERTSASGARRLVAVEVSMQARRSHDGRWGMNRWLQAWSFAPGSFDDANSSAPSGQLHIDSGAVRPPGEFDPITSDPSRPFLPPFPLRLYAGQPDPNDPSRFTIAYELQGHRGVITGVLNDDGSVWMTPDIGWHGRLNNIVSWVPKVVEVATTTTSPAAAP